MRKLFKNRFLISILSATSLVLPVLGQGYDEPSYVNNVSQQNLADQKINTSHIKSILPLAQSSNVVGNLAGQFAVDQEGSATYDIPIKVSPGTAGMAPQLSLHYDSSGGNGMLGMGFSLSGLTAISRVPQNYAQNGQIHGVDFTNNDRFALNGEQTSY